MCVVPAHDSNHRYRWTPGLSRTRPPLVRCSCTAFLRLSGALSADFTELMTIQFLITVMPFGGLEQAFPGVTPSFHLLNNQFYETCSEAPFNLLISFGSTPDLFSQERVAPPLVSRAR